MSGTQITMMQRFLNRYMEKNKVSKSELSRLLNLDYATVKNLANGQSGANIDALSRALKRIGYRIVIIKDKENENEGRG